MQYIARYSDGLVHVHEGDSSRAACGSDALKLDGNAEDELRDLCQSCLPEIERVLGLRPGELAAMMRSA